MHRVPKASKQPVGAAHVVIRSTHLGAMPINVKNYSMAKRSGIFAYCVDILLLVSFWHVRSANASTCPEGTYRESVKFKATLALNDDGCQPLSNGLYLEHDDPAELNGARVYKLQSTTRIRFMWWRIDRYVISGSLTGTSRFLQVLTSHRNIEFFGTWDVWCSAINRWTEFKDVMTVSIDSISCSKCPENSASSFGSTSIAACRCYAGYTGEGLCLACEPGKYKTQPGNTVCSSCPAGMTSAAGSVSATSCQCPSNTYKRVKFRAVLAANTNNCQAPSTGTYLEHDAPAEYNGARVYKLQSTTVTRFMWWRHWNNANRYVVNTQVGLNTNWNLDVATNDRDIEFLTTWNVWCGGPLGWINFRDIMTISVDSTSCQQCPENYESSLGSTSIASCQCQAGFTRNGANCLPCTTGTYNAIKGAGACKNCFQDDSLYSVQFSDKEAFFCTCDAATGELCVCGVGFFGDGFVCEACPANKYKPEVGNGECIDCVGITSGKDCTCTAGFTPGGSSCVECPTNTWKTDAGPTACTTCDTEFVTLQIGSTIASQCVCPVQYDATVLTEMHSKRDEYNTLLCIEMIA